MVPVKGTPAPVDSPQVALNQDPPAGRDGVTVTSWVRRLPAQVRSDLRSTLRIMSPRSTARMVAGLVWLTNAPMILNIVSRGTFNAVDAFNLVVASLFLAGTVPLLMLPLRWLAPIFLGLGLLAPASVLASVLKSPDHLTATTNLIQLNMVPVAAFMLWGRRLGIITTAASLGTVLAVAGAGVLPGSVVLASLIVVAVSGLSLGWAAYTSERLEHDQVTGLANRRGLERALERALGRPGVPVPFLALLDIDGVRHLNAERGRSRTDGLLAQVGAALAERLADRAVVFHLGSGEFAVLLAGPRQSAVEQVTALQATPVDGATLCAGLADAEPGDTAARLVNRAVASLARAKADGPDALDPLLAGDALLEELRTSLAEGRFTVLYQPIVDLVRGGTIGAEALVRWDHPTRGRVGPDDFVPYAERTGFVHDLGRYVLEAACLATVAAQEQDRWLDRIGVNVSPVELERPEFAEDVLAVLTGTGLEPRRLVLEVTESSLAGERADAAGQLGRLRAAGVRVAIDDFGTGYSSLSRLARLPVDLLKIDKSFVWADENTGRDSLLTAVVGLAAAFRLNTVAEGVETVEQATLLRGLGCEFGQGYLYGRPAAFDDLDLPAVAAGAGAGGPGRPDGQGPVAVLSPAAAVRAVPAARRPAHRDSSASAP